MLGTVTAPRPTSSSTEAEGFGGNDWLGRDLRVGDDLVVRVIARTPRCAVPTLAHGALPRDTEALRVPGRARS